MTGCNYDNASFLQYFCLLLSIPVKCMLILLYAPGNVSEDTWRSFCILAIEKLSVFTDRNKITGHIYAGD